MLLFYNPDISCRSPKEIAEEAKKAFLNDKTTPEEHFDDMVKAGFINKKGQVTKLLGGEADIDFIS